MLLDLYKIYKAGKFPLTYRSSARELLHICSCPLFTSDSAGTDEWRLDLGKFGAEQNKAIYQILSSLEPNEWLFSTKTPPLSIWPSPLDFPSGMRFFAMDWGLVVLTKSYLHYNYRTLLSFLALYNHSLNEKGRVGTGLEIRNSEPGATFKEFVEKWPLIIASPIKNWLHTRGAT